MYEGSQNILEKGSANIIFLTPTELNFFRGTKLLV